MQQPKHYYPGLDVLRGIAILLVIGRHYFGFARFGWIGVDLFFVLSGFLITNGLLSTLGRPDFFRHFYRRRALRILPLYLLLLMLFYSFAPFVFTQKQPGSTFQYYVTNQAWFWTFTQNWLFVLKGVPPAPHLQHLWSLAVEEQFYLIWPVLIAVTVRLRIVRTFLCFLFATAFGYRLFVHFHPVGYQSFYYASVARFDALAAGAFLSVLHRRGVPFRPLLFYLFITAFAALWCIAWFGFANVDYNSPAFRTAGYSVSAVFFALLLQRMLAMKKDGKVLRALRYLGKISYGIYIYHVPVLFMGGYALSRLPFFHRNLVWQSVIPFICIAATLLISQMSYAYFERRFLRLKNTHDAAAKHGP